MKTSVIEVKDMLSVLSVDELEKRIGEVPGVGSATVNSAAGNATVRFDETRLEIHDIRSAVRLKGYETEAPAAASEGEQPKGHTATPPIATEAAASGGDTAQPDKPAPSTTPKPSAADAPPPPELGEAKPAPPAPDAPTAPPVDKQKDKVGSDKD